MADLILGSSGRGIGLAAVFASLERIERALTERQRSDLMAMAARAGATIALEDEDGEPVVHVASDRPDPEAALMAERRSASLTAALQTLPAEDRVIVSMRVIDGLALPEIKRALHLPSLTPDRVAHIVASLRSALERLEGDPA